MNDETKPAAAGEPREIIIIKILSTPTDHNSFIITVDWSMLEPLLGTEWEEFANKCADACMKTYGDMFVNGKPNWDIKRNERKNKFEPSSYQ